jgi:hypothetical protein
MLRMEDRIRSLCSQLLATKDDEEVGLILVDLREALRIHIKRLRERCGAYPNVVERRIRNDIPALAHGDKKEASRKAVSTDRCS